MAAKKPNTIKVAFKKLVDDAKIPAKPKSKDDAGFDLYSNQDIVIKPHRTVCIKTGCAVQLTPPDGWNAYAKVEDTSGNAANKKLSVKAGVIDIGYTGDVGVVIKNNNMFKKINIKKGDKIAQLIPYLIPFAEEADWVEKETVRGSDGFGSTGQVNG